MRKFVHIFALLVLFAGSAIDTLGFLVPSRMGSSQAEKSQPGSSNQRDLANDDLIVYRHADQLSERAGARSRKYLPPFPRIASRISSALPPVSGTVSEAKQEPGYGSIFRYHLF